MCEIGNGFMLLFLGVCSLKDLKTRRIPTYLLVTCSIILFLSLFVDTGRKIPDTIEGICIGTLSCMISRYTKEAIGYGDSWIILLLGAYLGGKKLLELLLLAFFLAGIVSFGILVRKKWKRDCVIPLVPFLTIAYIGVVYI